MFIAALFTIAKIWKQPMCQPIDEWITKVVVHLHIEYYVAAKKNNYYTLQWHGWTWRKLS